MPLLESAKLRFFFFIDSGSAKVVFLPVGFPPTCLYPTVYSIYDFTLLLASSYTCMLNNLCFEYDSFVLSIVRTNGKTAIQKPVLHLVVM